MTGNIGGVVPDAKSILRGEVLRLPRLVEKKVQKLDLVFDSYGVLLYSNPDHSWCGGMVCPS